MKSASKENYLKAIFELQRFNKRVSTKALSDHLGFRPASVTGMMKKLAADNLIQYVPYDGALLTQAGEKIALGIIRKHRLIELFLVNVIGLGWDKVHCEAEQWEHVVSDETLEKINKILGYPAYDPHGSVIPEKDGRIQSGERKLINNLQTGDNAVIAEVDDSDPSRLVYFGQIGIKPGVPVEVVKTEPFSGPITLKIDGKKKIIGHEVANFVFVKEVNKQ